jgi:hypothetical protein
MGTKPGRVLGAALGVRIRQDCKLLKTGHFPFTACWRRTFLWAGRCLEQRASMIDTSPKWTYPSQEHSLLWNPHNDTVSVY